jgi:hypothetical protein
MQRGTVIIAIVVTILHSQSILTGYAWGGPSNSSPAADPTKPATLTSPGDWVPLASGTSSMLWDVFGGASYAMAAGANGTLLIYDGLAWTTVLTPTTSPIYSVWGPSQTDAFMVGAAGRILRFDGVVVSQMPFVTSANLNGVWGYSSNDVFAVGDNGTTLRFDGREWRRIQSGTSSRLLDVAGSTRGPVFAVGNAGTILRFDGDSWALDSTPTTLNLGGIWVVGEDDAFAVGAHGTVLHYDGVDWQLMDTPTTANLNDVWGVSDTQVFAVGDNGTLLAFDGAQWRLSNLGTSAVLNGIHNGFVVGANGTIRQNTTLFREVANLRITEVDPVTGQVEVTNTGPAFTSGAHPFCHRFDCDSEIPNGTTFLANEIKLFAVPSLNRKDTDLWLYRTVPFYDPNNLVHGVKYGPQADVGQTTVAVEGGKWPSTETFSPAPPSRTTLAYDGYGLDPKDWYIDETPTLGGPDFTPSGTVPASLTVLEGRQNWEQPGFSLSGTEDFEDVLLGDEVNAISGWSIENASRTRGIYTGRVVSDVMGAVAPRGLSTRWLRIRDQNDADVRNDFVSPAIDLPPGDIVGYSWTFWMNLEEAPGAGPDYPRFMIQHEDNGFENAWGVELRPDNVCLVVTDFGGDQAAECSLGLPAPLGEWSKLTINVDFDLGLADLSFDDEPVAVLPIELDANAHETVFRFSYQGSGVGNTGTTLLDDVTVDIVPLVQPFFASVSARANENDVELSWRIYDDEPGGGFMIYRQIDGSQQTVAAGPLVPDARQFRDTNLSTGHTYRYVVGALVGSAEEIHSQAATVRIEKMPAVVFKEVHATPLGDVVELVWDLDINEPIAGIRVYRTSSLSNDETDMTGEALLPPDTRHFQDTAIRRGHWYSHVVAAVTSEGTEIRSEMSFVAIPSPPLEVFGVFPNPFSVSTRLDFSLAEPGNVRVNVYDVRGKFVATLSDKQLREGEQSVTWNGRDAKGHQVSAGTYFFKLETRGSVLTRKVVVVR